MNYHLAIGLATLLAAAPMTALAEPSYNYADFGYANFDRSGQSSRSGFGGNVVFSFTDNFHYTIGHVRVDSNAVDSNGTVLAFGYNMPFSDNADFVARLGWAWTQSQSTGPKVKDDGIAASVGIRTMFFDDFELSAMLNYADTVRSRTSIGVEGTYFFTESLGIFLGGDFGRGRLLRVGMRFSFDGY